MNTQGMLDIFNMYLIESYKDDSEYKALQQSISSLKTQIDELKSKEPKEDNPSDEDMRVICGFSEDEWEELSKTEKETFYSMFKPNKSEHDIWFDEYHKLKEELNTAFNKMKNLQEKEYKNQYSNKDISLGVPTDKRNFKYFKADTNEYHQDYLEDIDYAYSKGYTNVYISEMTPEEYMEACAKYIFKTPIEDSYDGMLEKDNVKVYAKKMKNGEKFDLPYIDIKKGQQEGRHRALAMKELGVDKFPVLVLE